MDYLEKQIKKYDIFWNIAAVIMVLAVFFLGVNFKPKSLIEFFVIGIILGLIAFPILYLLEFFKNKIDNYIKGKWAENYVVGWLEKIPGITVIDRNIKVQTGDLDILVKDSRSQYFGIEVKNFYGRVSTDAKNSELFINNFNENKIINNVKSASAEVRDKLAAKENVAFVNPVVVFLDNNLCIDVPDNIIKSGNADVHVIGLSQVNNFFR